MPDENYSGRYLLGRDFRELSDELMRMSGKDKLTYPSDECIKALARWSRDNEEMAGHEDYGHGILVIIEIEVQRRLAFAKAENTRPDGREGGDGQL